MQVPAQQRGLHVTLISVETSSDVSASNIFECVSNCWTLCDFRLLQVKGDPSTSFFCQIAVPWQLFGKPLKAMTSSSFYIKFQLWSKFLIYSISSVCVYETQENGKSRNFLHFPRGWAQIHAPLLVRRRRKQLPGCLKRSRQGQSVLILHCNHNRCQGQGNATKFALRLGVIWDLWLLIPFLIRKTAAFACFFPWLPISVTFCAPFFFYEHFSALTHQTWAANFAVNMIVCARLCSQGFEHRWIVQFEQGVAAATRACHQQRHSQTLVKHDLISHVYLLPVVSSSTTQGGGGSFKGRKL